jgi:hypothetical protein
MRRLAVLAGCIASITASAPTHANFLDGNDLYERCQTRRSSALDYILGVHDAQQAVAGLGRQQKLICPWGRVNSGNVINVVCNYLRDNPAQRGRSGASIVLEALGEAFPCR